MLSARADVRVDRMPRERASDRWRMCRSVPWIIFQNCARNAVSPFPFPFAHTVDLDLPLLRWLPRPRWQRRDASAGEKQPRHQRYGERQLVEAASPCCSISASCVALVRHRSRQTPRPRVEGYALCAVIDAKPGDLSDLTLDELDTVAGWVSRFKSKYPVVARLPKPAASKL